MDFSNPIFTSIVRDFVLYVIGPTGIIWGVFKLIQRKVIAPRVKFATNFFGQIESSIGDIAKIKDTLENVIKTDIKMLKVMSATQQAHMELLANVAIHDPLWFADIEGKTTGINQQFTNILGWTPLEMQGYGWKRIIHPEDQESYYTQWDLCVKEERDFVFECRVMTRDEHVIPATVRAARKVVPYNGSSVVVWLGVIQVTPIISLFD